MVRQVGYHMSDTLVHLLFICSGGNCSFLQITKANSTLWETQMSQCVQKHRYCTLPGWYIYVIILETKTTRLFSF